jgi:hypothetical protein
MMITETLAQIRAPHFTAGIVLWDDKVVEAANIVRYMKKWPRDRVRQYVGSKKWSISVVYEQRRQRTYEGLDDRK